MSGNEIAFVSVGTVLSDGGSLLRRWYVTPERAEELAEQLGAPDREVLATLQAIEEIDPRSVLDVPGIVITTPGAP